MKEPNQLPKSPEGILQDVPNLPAVVLQDLEGVNTVTFGCEKEPSTPGAKQKPPNAAPKQGESDFSGDQVVEVKEFR